MSEDVNIKMTVDAGQSIQATNNYKKTLKELKDQMVQLQIETNGLADATAEQRQQYAELEQQAGAITDALGDVSAQIRANADDYQMFNAALEGLKGGAAVAQGLVGTLDMLGISNSGVEQVVKTLMSLQGVMNSINAVQQIFNKDSKVRIALQKLLTTTTNQTAVADAQATAATGALAAGEGVATTTSFTLVGALKAVSAAIMSIPLIGWILAAIAALTTLIGLVVAANKEEDLGNEIAGEILEKDKERQAALDDITKKYEKIREEMGQQVEILQSADKNTRQYKDALASVSKELDVSKSYVEAHADEMAKAVEVAENYNETTEKLAKNEEEHDKALKDKEALINRINEIMNEGYETSQASLQKLVDEGKITEDQQKRLQTYRNQRARSEISLYNAQQSAQVIINEQVASYNTIIDRTNTQISQLKTKQAEQKKFLNDLQTESDTYDEQLKKQEEEKKKREQAAAAWKKWKQEKDAAQKSYIKDIEDRAIADAEYDKDWNRWAEERTKKSNRQYEDDLASYKDQLNQKLISQEQYNSLVASLEEEHQNDLAKIQADAQKKIQDEKDAAKKLQDEKDEEAKKQAAKDKQDARDRVDRENQVDSEILNARLANLKEGTDLYYETKRELEEEQHEQDMEDLRRRLDDGQLTQEEYDRLAEETERQHQQNLTNIQAEQDAARLELTQNRLETVGQMLQMASNFTQSLMDAELAAAGEDEKKQKEIKKKYAVANAMMQIGQIGVQTALGAISAFQAMSGIPVVGPALGAVAAALVTATGIAQMVKAGQEANKIRQAARGAYVVGPSHSEGGVNYELEGGEAVLNKKAMAIPQYRALASAMNVSTGGVAFPGAGNAAPLQASMDQGTVKSIVKETVAAVTAIPVVVSEESISKTQRKVSVLEGQSRI